MTDATGRSFLSYRRIRIDEARLLIEAQHDVGIPTWQDLTELDEGHTEALLREAIADETTANAGRIRITPAARPKLPALCGAGPAVGFGFPCLLQAHMAGIL